MTVTFTKRNRRYHLKSGAVAQEIVNRIYSIKNRGGFSESAQELIDDYFKGFAPVSKSEARNSLFSKLNAKNQMPTWVLNFKLTLKNVFTAALAMVCMPFVLQFMLSSLFLEDILIVAFIAGFSSMILGQLIANVFSGPAHLSVNSQPIVREYVQHEYDNLIANIEFGNDQDKENAIDQLHEAVEGLLKNGGVLEKLMSFFGSQNEVPLSSITFYAAGIAGVGISSLGLLGFVPMTPLVNLVVAAISSLSLICGKLMAHERVETIKPLQKAMRQSSAWQASADPVRADNIRVKQVTQMFFRNVQESALGSEQSRAFTFS